MKRVLWAGLIGLACLGLGRTVAAQGVPGGVIPRVPLRQHGLERAWVTQADISPGRSRIASLSLHKNVLFVQSDVGRLQAIDAETGRTLWRTQVGNPQLPSVPPGIGEDYVAVANGANLYVLSRADGRIRLEFPLENSPSAGLAVGNNRVYVPTVLGRIESYILTEVKDAETVVAPPRTSQIFFGVNGIPQTPCLLTPNAIVVGTDSGDLFGFAPGSIGPRYSVKTYGEISDMPAYHDGKVIVGSLDQFVYAVREGTGDIVWRTSLDEPINHSPVVIGNALYAVAELSGLHQMDVTNGDEKWYARGVTQFVAAGSNKVYAADRVGRLLVLDAATGRQLDVLGTEAYPIKLTNTENDRIYLSSSTGVLHCLRETALTEPIVYRTTDPPKPAETQQKPLEDAAAPAEAPSDEEAMEEEPAEEEPAEDAEAEEDDLSGFGE